MRPDHGDGEGVHRSSRHRRRAVRASSRRARSRLPRDLRTLPAAQHGGFDSSKHSKGRSSRSPTSSTRCANASGSAWCRPARRTLSRFAAPRKAWSRSWPKRSSIITLDALVSRRAARFHAGAHPILFPRSSRLQIRRSQRRARHRASAPLADVEARLAALANVRPTPDFEPLAASFKRIHNILKQASFSRADAPSGPGLLEAGPEQDLYARFPAHSSPSLAPTIRPRSGSIASLRPARRPFLRQSAGERPGPERPRQPPDPA